jgi:hypothetical protein
MPSAEIVFLDLIAIGISELLSIHRRKPRRRDGDATPPGVLWPRRP